MMFKHISSFSRQACLPFLRSREHGEHARRLHVAAGALLAVSILGCENNPDKPADATPPPAHVDQRGALHEGDRMVPGEELHSGDVNHADDPGLLQTRDR